MAARPFNFSAGPAILPVSVTERAAEAVRELKTNAHADDGEGIGLSLLELSHRGGPYTEVHDAAVSLVHSVLGVPNTHQVIFLQGGASMQFAMVPMHFRNTGKTLAYVDTGAWSKKAIREAKLQGEVAVLAGSADTGYDRIPALPSADAYADSAYVHITSNNTIHGTEFKEFPALEGGVPLVVDCSSNIGSKEMEWNRVGIGYAGAQKNLGPSGLTLLIVDKALLEHEVDASVPHFFRYVTHVGNNPSRYNTPNTFATLVLKLMLEWLRDEGGPKAIAQTNARKAKTLYDCIDASALFSGTAQADSRSTMNVTFVLDGAPEDKREEMTKRFIAEATAAGLDSLKGHRSVGGCRASIYNAFPQEGVDALVAFMQEFEKKA